MTEKAKNNLGLALFGGAAVVYLGMVGFTGT